jgi:tetratricopeptide (TPR) repeat protein
VASRVRPIRRSVALIAAAIAVLLRVPPAAAQPSTDYVVLVDRYASGDAAGALAALTHWNAGAAKSAAATHADRLTPARQRAAIMLHTDFAYAALVARATADASTHVGLARRLIAAMKSGDPDRDRARRFEVRWFAFAGSMYTAMARLDIADAIVRDGLTLYPRDARLHVARGAIREMIATLNAADPRSRYDASRTNRVLESASADYRRAIAYDDSFAPAHLHLGWVRLVARDDRSGSDFEAALARATDDDTRYLAHLFLGAFAERHERLEDARTHYQEAMRTGPRYQTGYVALSRIEEALGRPARAQEFARSFASLADKREDPWWNYHLGGFDQASLDWLRAEAHAP